MMLALLGRALATEPTEPIQTVAGPATDEVLMARMYVRAGVESGRRREGYGTRLPFVAGEGSYVAELSSFGSRGRGGGFGLDAGASTLSQDPSWGRFPQVGLWGGPLVAPVRSERAVLAFGLFPALSVGVRPSSSLPVRLYPLLSAELRTELGPALAGGILLKASPLSTDALLHQQGSVELWLSMRSVMFGAWVRGEHLRVGDPARAYGSTLLGLQVGGALRN